MTLYNASAYNIRIMVKAKSTKKTTAKVADKKATANAAKARELASLKETHEKNEKGRMIALVISLFLNLFFLVTIYAIETNGK